MDARDRLFGEIAVRLQLLTREQVETCTACGDGKRLEQAAIELGLLSSDEAALVSAQAERAFAREQRERAAARAAAAPVRVEEERMQRPDPRASRPPANEDDHTSMREPRAAAEVPAGRPRKRGARAWEVPDAVEQGQIQILVPRTAAAPPPPAGPLARAPTLATPAAPIELAATALGTTPDDTLQPQPSAAQPDSPDAAIDSFPLAQGDEAARVELSGPPPAAPAAPPDPAPAPPAARAPAPPPPPSAARAASPARAPAPAPANAAAPPPDPVAPAIPTPPPPKAAAQRPAAALAPQDSYLGKALALALRHGASDLHVHSGAPLLVRIDGRLRPLSGTAALSADAAEKIIAELTTDAQWALLARRGEVDFACELPGLCRARANVYRQQRGVDAVFRIVRLRPPTLEELGLPARLARLTDFRTGMVLCTGPAGCGKSTTLAALLHALVQTRADHILTIEDPVEYVFSGGRALVNQRQIGDHTSSFARALRAALREDPDIIAITELRDRETIALAISAAETGHLVLGTLHTGSAAQTIHRIVSSFPQGEQEQVRVMLAESLRAVVSQRLLPMAVGRGRVPAIELLMVNTAVSNLIREDKTHQLPSVMQTGKAAGMLMLDDSLHELVAAGIVAADAARRVAVKKERFG